MKKIKIGKKIESSAVALGCMRIGGLDEKQIDELVDTALENGVNYFDHADIYGKGKSEEVFGGYLSRHSGAREKMIIQSKCAIHDATEVIVKAVVKPVFGAEDEVFFAFLCDNDTDILPGNFIQDCIEVRREFGSGDALHCFCWM